jgi:hypothetical protein
LGSRSGLVTRINAFTDRETHAIHCMAHRVQLLGRHAISDFEETEYLENCLNGVSSYYNRQGHKRKTHLRQTAMELGVGFLEVNRVYESRWVASEVR